MSVANIEEVAQNIGNEIVFETAYLNERSCITVRCRFVRVFLQLEPIAFDIMFAAVAKSKTS